jgi:antitoxin component YwqK of YwqJK toxin-antitoxin module
MSNYLLKNITLIIPALSFLYVSISFTDCTEKQNTRTNLIFRNGLLYKSGSNTPYTGREKAEIHNRIIEYDVVNGIKSGEFKIYYAVGKPQVVGQMVNNKNEGLWKYYYENSQIESEGNFKNDLPEGEWIFYYSNGKIKEDGNYIYGKRDGNWRDYEESGKIFTQSKFKDGKLLSKK